MNRILEKKLENINHYVSKIIHDILDGTYFITIGKYHSRRKSNNDKRNSEYEKNTILSFEIRIILCMNR
ncbi:hypothetical protein DERP_004054 [Dermatophagoides pteronyssinus]|uniref:Uncharacterized protein n=1 Tax=Dermatophagoides pteronyssinus TaxID=6956 RepID=A0ABQ8J853_DERPT|nr:hypothetical protein DERP_004054 [Dermatophagoides pteronyssinus]